MDGLVELASIHCNYASQPLTVPIFLDPIRTVARLDNESLEQNRCTLSHFITQFDTF